MIIIKISFGDWNESFYDVFEWDEFNEENVINDMWKEVKEYGFGEKDGIIVKGDDIVLSGLRNEDDEFEVIYVNYKKVEGKVLEYYGEMLGFVSGDDIEFDEIESDIGVLGKDWVKSDLGGRFLKF